MGFELQHIVIVVLIMSAFVLGVSNFTGDLYSRYPASQNVSYFEASSKTMTHVSQMQDTIYKTNIATIMITGVWNMFTILFDVLETFISLITDTISVFQIPGYEDGRGFVGIFAAIITVMVVFGIAYAVMNMPR
jgi:hypothetical protein